MLSWILNNFKDGDSKPVWASNLHQCLTLFILKDLFLGIYMQFPMSHHWTPRKKKSLSFLKPPHHVLMCMNKGPMSIYVYEEGAPEHSQFSDLSQGWRRSRGACSSLVPAFSLSEDWGTFILAWTLSLAFWKIMEHLFHIFPPTTTGFEKTAVPLYLVSFRFCGNYSFWSLKRSHFTFLLALVSLWCTSYASLVSLFELSTAVLNMLKVKAQWRG